jgi:branched-chain amino acid transport system ATP-binding protein
MSVLEARELSIRFGGLQAAREVTIHVDEFEIVGIIGPNGAGKTTTFNMITGFYTPDSGSVWYRGQDITSLKVHERAALGIGRTFQNVGLVKGSTVRENLLTAQHLSARYGVIGGIIGSPVAIDEERTLRRRADALLEVLQLGHLADTQVTGLPYGDLKRVEIATVLATDPDVLLLDEPSSGMGPEESERLGDVLLDLRREFALTIAMIEHHVPLVVRVCDYVYCLNFGELLAEGRPDVVRNHPEVVRAYMGEDVDEEATV